MSVLGIDEISYGADDLAACRQFFLDWGLSLVDEQADRLVFETLNGCRVIVAASNHPDLPPAIEAEIVELDDEEKQLFLADLGLEEPGLDRLIHAAYHLLGLQTYFTAGVKEVRAWTIHKGDTAPQAAGVIHTDFERGFIRAQTIAFADFIAYKGEAGAKEAGKMRAEGKEYVVHDGDVMNFLFNV